MPDPCAIQGARVRAGKDVNIRGLFGVAASSFSPCGVSSKGIEVYIPAHGHLGRNSIKPCISSFDCQRAACAQENLVKIFADNSLSVQNAESFWEKKNTHSYLYMFTSEYFISTLVLQRMKK